MKSVYNCLMAILFIMANGLSSGAEKPSKSDPIIIFEALQTIQAKRVDASWNLRGEATTAERLLTEAYIASLLHKADEKKAKEGK